MCNGFAFKTHHIMFVIIPAEVNNFLLLRKSHQAKLLVLVEGRQHFLLQKKSA